tara:strand:- start:268 stop:1152 length:885 start_codon:yes stop_codon:yes gene_type:complete
LVDRLLANGDTVVGVDDMSSGKLSNLPEEFDLRHLDIRDSRLKDVFDEVRPDVVFHLAAQISVSNSARNPKLDADVNIGGALNLLECMKAQDDNGASLVYVTSGGTAYGQPEVLPADENTPIRPLSPYGASKFAVETYLPIYENLSGLTYSVVRLGNVYGPRQDPHGEAGVVAIFSRAMLTGTSLQIFGDGTDERDYVHVDDVVEAIIRAGARGYRGPFNIGSGLGTSTNRIFELLAEYCSHDHPPDYGESRPGDIKAIALDSKKAKIELGWDPIVSLEDGLRATVEWFKAHPI